MLQNCAQSYDRPFFKYTFNSVKQVRGQNYVDHTIKTQQGPNVCRPATPVTKRTIEIGVSNCKNKIN